MNLLARIVKYVGLQWSLKWGVMANLWHVLIFQIAVTLKRLLKQLVLHVQLVKGDVVERKSKKIAYFMVVLIIQNVILFHGINQLEETVQNVSII